MTGVRACALPAGSALHSYRTQGDFLDCYSVPAQMSPRRAAERITEFPGWAHVLLQLRRVVTAPFGLKNDAPPGVESVGPFPVIQETETELLAGFDDKHLNFLVSVYCADGLVHLATWVEPHNLAGRAYLTAIMPFHIWIARDALRRVAEAEGRAPA